MSYDDVLQAHVLAVTGMVNESGVLIAMLADRLAASFNDGGKLLVCGNGGSAADAQHFVAEFVNRMRFDHPPLPALALTTDTSVISSIANDSRFENVFARQVQAFGRAGDVLVGLSTSGRSPNVLAALQVGSAMGLVTVAFTGASGAAHMDPFASLVLAVPSDDTPRIQEAHEFAYHVIAEMVEARVFADGRRSDCNGR